MMWTKFWRTSVLVLLLAATTIGSASAQINPIVSVSFGDSLSDNDLLYWLFPNPPFYQEPDSPLLYGEDPFEALFLKAALPTDSLTQYAVLGSTSAQVREQVSQYMAEREAGNMPPATLVSVQGGGNDLLFNVEELAFAAPGESERADKIINAIFQNLRDACQTLRNDSDCDIVLWTVPDITLIPQILYLQLPDFAVQNLRAHLDRLNRKIRNMGRLPRVAVLDFYQINQQLVFSPPVIAGTSLIGPPFFGTLDSLFADPIHPTAVTNGLIANAMIEVVNAEFGDAIPTYTEAELAAKAGLN